MDPEARRPIDGSQPGELQLLVLGDPDRAAIIAWPLAWEPELELGDLAFMAADASIRWLPKKAYQPEDKILSRVPALASENVTGIFGQTSVKTFLGVDQPSQTSLLFLYRDTLTALEALLEIERSLQGELPVEVATALLIVAWGFSQRDQVVQEPIEKFIHLAILITTEGMSSLDDGQIQARVNDYLLNFMDDRLTLTDYLPEGPVGCARFLLELGQSLWRPKVRAHLSQLRLYRKSVQRLVAVAQAYLQLCKESKVEVERHPIWFRMTSEQIRACLHPDPGVERIWHHAAGIAFLALSRWRLPG